MNKVTTLLNVCTELASAKCDSLVLVLEDIGALTGKFSFLIPCLQPFHDINKKFTSGAHVLHCESIPSKRLVASFTGPLDRDYDDVRRIGEAARDGVSQAIKAGSVNPLLALAPLKSTEKLKAGWMNPKSLSMTALLGGLHALYVPLEVREFAGQPHATVVAKSIKSSKAESLSWFSGSHLAVDHEKLVRLAWSLEEGRRVARDIGGSDPERMCASHIVSYLKTEFANSDVNLEIGPVEAGQYPLAAVVDRGSDPRHAGSIVHLEYTGQVDAGTSESDLTDLYLVGKGIVYDTGGSDLKISGNMATMHRDKCGAAAVAGFFKAASLLSPKNIRLHGSLAIVRNSIGPNAYVSDEIVTSRAGVRVRVNNTDAEGRMVMADLLCEAKERASQVSNPHLMTLATLTGHAILTYGPEYTAIVCNGPARCLKSDFVFQDAGSLLGEMSEISTLRREDYDAYNAQEEYADLINTSRPVGGRRVRGHQSPAAFMILASGLDSHMNNAEKPLPYTHFDIAGSQGPCPGIPTAVPLLTLASRYLLREYWL